VGNESDLKNLKIALKIISMPKHDQKDQAIALLAKFLKRPDALDFREEVYSAVFAAFNKTKESTLKGKYQQLLHLCDSANFTELKDAEGYKPPVEAYKEEVAGAGRRAEEKKAEKAQKRKSLLLYLGIGVLVSVGYLGVNYFLKKQTVRSQKKSANQYIDETLNKVRAFKRKNAENAVEGVRQHVFKAKPKKAKTKTLQDKKSNASSENDNSEVIKYTIKFHPKVGMLLKIKTRVIKRTIVGKKVVKKVEGDVYRIEKIINLHDDSFRTKMWTKKASKSLKKNLNYYKFIGLGERANVIYTPEGKVRDFQYYGKGKVVWYPLSFYDFVYPRSFVAIHEKWGTVPGDSLEEGLLSYKFTGFEEYRGKKVARIEMASLKSFTMMMNDYPSTKTPAVSFGHYYIDAESGQILYMKFQEDYKYTLRKPGAKVIVSFTYKHESY
jgi:hypothetical protein